MAKGTPLTTRKARSAPRIREGDYWKRQAIAFARIACENHFSSRRGVWHITDHGVLCIYNNNPYEHFPMQREEELAEFRRRLAEEKIVELGFGTYPPAGEESAGYTQALIIDAGKERTDWVVDTMKTILTESWKKMTRQDS